MTALLLRALSSLHWAPAHWVCAPLLACALYLAGLGAVPLQLSDEPREAEIAREMWVTGPLDVPRLNGRPYVIKPPLAYWAAAGVFALAGDPTPGEGLVRLPSALFTLGSAALVALVGWRWLSLRHGLLAALILCASPGVLSHGRRFTSDPALAFGVSVAIGAGLCALRAEGTRRALLMAVGGGVGLALGFLAKGPIAPALVGATLLAAVLVARGPRGLVAGRPLLVAGTLLALLAPAALLWAWLLERAGGEALQQFVLDYHARGLTGEGDPALGPPPHVREWWYYLVHGPDGFLPWLLFLPLLLLARGAPASPASAEAGPAPSPRRLLAVWALAPLVFLTLLSQKRTVYALPLYPPLALLAACALLDPLPAGWPRLTSGLRTAWRVLGPGAALGAGGVALWGLASREPRALLLLVLGGLILALVRRDARERAAPLPYPFGTVSAVALLILGLLVVVEPLARQERTLRPFARELAAQLAEEPRAELHGFRISDDTGRVDGAVAFELGRTFPVVPDAPALQALLRADPQARVLMDLPEWEREGRPGRVVASFRTYRRELVLVAREERP